MNNPPVIKKVRKIVYTISDILQDIQRGIFANNMNENKFTYRVVFFVNNGSKGTKHYIDTSYENLRRSLENIIRGNLTTTNNIVIAAVTTIKNRKCICLQSRSYGFCLNEYFDRVTERHEIENKKKNTIYGNTYRKKVGNW